MKKKILLPMPPVDQLPYENLKEEWNSLTFDLYVIRMAQLYWASWSRTEKIWTNFMYNNNAWGIISDPYSWIILPDKTIEKRWTKDLPREIQDWEENLTYDGYPLFMMTLPEEETHKKFDGLFDEGEIIIFPTSNLLFTIYSHESFHGFQSMWSFPEDIIEINTPETISILEKNPHGRELRLELYKNLHNAILNPDHQEEYLSIAKYWLNTYYKEYEEEANLLKSIDIHEGSARYFDMSITCRALFGFDMTKEELKNVYSRLLTSYYTVTKLEQDPVLEVYIIGGLSGILLELKRHDDWQQRVESGERLQDILLESIKPNIPKFS